MQISCTTRNDNDRPRREIRGVWLWTSLLVLAGLFVQRFDLWLVNHAQLESLPGDLRRIFNLSELFAHGFGLVLVAVGIWMLSPSNRRYLPRVISCAVLPSLACLFFKSFWSRARPNSYRQSDWSLVYPNTIEETWFGFLPHNSMNLEYMTQSFPSAHTATVCGLAIGLSQIFPSGKRLFWLVALLASFQRIVSLAHWPSDVCFGAALAILMAGSLSQNWGWGYVLGRIERRFKRVDMEIQPKRASPDLQNRVA